MEKSEEGGIVMASSSRDIVIRVEHVNKLYGANRDEAARMMEAGKPNTNFSAAMTTVLRKIIQNSAPGCVNSVIKCEKPTHSLPKIPSSTV